MPTRIAIVKQPDRLTIAQNLLVIEQNPPTNYRLFGPEVIPKKEDKIPPAQPPPSPPPLIFHNLSSTHITSPTPILNTLLNHIPTHKPLLLHLPHGLQECLQVDLIRRELRFHKGGTLRPCFVITHQVEELGGEVITRNHEGLHVDAVAGGLVRADEVDELLCAGFYQGVLLHYAAVYAVHVLAHYEDFMMAFLEGLGGSALLSHKGFAFG